MTAGAPELLVLHAVRVVGFGETDRLARRYGLDESLTAELLADARARGWVSYMSFAGLGGWSLTEQGRAEDERLLAVELEQRKARDVVAAVHEEFLPLNARLQSACTRWQVRPAGADRLAANDHTDPEWDEGVVAELGALGTALGPLVDRLVGAVPRFQGYDTRFLDAWRRAREGEGGWIDRTDVDSCQRVWFELHEDLVATLGIDRRAQT